ncbi:MAG: trypsin-like serine protease [Alphaproteobacteria bacterium]|nr:trypsin-like serine protease [Alphaproteobacteria bacterium]
MGSDVIDSIFDKRIEIFDSHKSPWVINAQLIATFPTGARSRGTATLINKNCLVTAGHCLYDNDEGGYATNVELVFGRYDNRFLIKSISNQFIVHPEYVKNDENFDFSLINLKDDIGNKLGWASIKVFDDKELDKKRVNISGYPGTKGFFNTLLDRPSYRMYTMEGTILSVKKHKIYYDVDTSGGQSGSAVWALDLNGIPQCLAIHTTGKSSRVEGNGAVRMNEENFNILMDWADFYQKKQ